MPGRRLRRARLGGVCDERVAAVLADQPVDLDRLALQLPARSDARDLGDAARRDPVGRELSAGARRGGRRGQDSARLVGGVYAANTVGAIVGALVTGLVLVGTFGSQIAAAGADRRRGAVRAADADAGDGEPSPIPVAGAGHGRGVAAPVCWRASVPPLPGILVAYGRYAATWVGQNEIIYVGEGITASVAVSRTPNGVLNYHNAGKVQASSEPQDMRLQRMLGHITTLVPEEPEPRAGDRLRRRRDGRRRVDRSAGQGPDDRRDRAAGPAGGLDVLRRAQLRRRPESRR